MRVDFPEPEAPTRATKEPGGMVRVRFVRTGVERVGSVGGYFGDVKMR